MTSLPVCYQPPEFIRTEVLYVDEDVLLVNKPAGLLSVPGRGEDKKDCLISRVQLDYPDALVVHRLDMQTSGLMLLARNKHSHARLSRQFEQREISKEYIAVVSGIIQNDSGEIDLPLITDWPNRPRQKVDFDSGKASITRYQVIKTDTDQQTTRVLLKPLTGRSHQLRVHLLAIGHVILGDRLYASEQLANSTERLLLHASKLEFRHPLTGKTVNIESEVPF